jgi:hypothetical protein
MRIQGHGAAYAEPPWSEIVPGLFMGGHLCRLRSGECVPVVVGAEFDMVISLSRRDGHGPDSGVMHYCLEIPDGPLTAEQLAGVCDLAGFAEKAVRDGQSVLVRCHYGDNRSGLVVAQTLLNLGHSVEHAIALIRRRRSPWTLRNRLFVDYLTTGLSVAELLAGLDG